jgi:hypothetical protein
MEIIFTWSWLAFFAGVLATLTVQFWLLVFVAFRQWKKGQQAKSSVEQMFEQWGKAK